MTWHLALRWKRQKYRLPPRQVIVVQTAGAQVEWRITSSFGVVTDPIGGGWLVANTGTGDNDTARANKSQQCLLLDMRSSCY